MKTQDTRTYFQKWNAENSGFKNAMYTGPVISTKNNTINSGKNFTKHKVHNVTFEENRSITQNIKENRSITQNIKIAITKFNTIILFQAWNDKRKRYEGFESFGSFIETLIGAPFAFASDVVLKTLQIATLVACYTVIPAAFAAIQIAKLAVHAVTAGPDYIIGKILNIGTEKQYNYANSRGWDLMTSKGTGFFKTIGGAILWAVGSPFAAIKAVGQLVNFIVRNIEGFVGYAIAKPAEFFAKIATADFSKDIDNKGQGQGATPLVQTTTLANSTTPVQAKTDAQNQASAAKTVVITGVKTNTQTATTTSTGVKTNTQTATTTSTNVTTNTLIATTTSTTAPVVASQVVGNVQTATTTSSAAFNKIDADGEKPVSVNEPSKFKTMQRILAGRNAANSSDAPDEQNTQPFVINGMVLKTRVLVASPEGVTNKGVLPDGQRTTTVSTDANGAGTINTVGKVTPMEKFTKKERSPTNSNPSSPTLEKKDKNVVNTSSKPGNSGLANPSNKTSAVATVKPLAQDNI